MSNSKVNFNNITYRSNKNSILVGEIKINTSAPDSINIPPKAESCTSHIVLQKGDDSHFKSHFLTAPVVPHDIYLYDQCAHMFSNYNKERANNAHGTVKITAENKVLFSNIQLPVVAEGQVYLVINSYAGLVQCSIDSSKKFLVENDLESFSKKYDLTKVILFISTEIANELDRLKINFRTYFKDVNSTSHNRMADYLAEYFGGRTITGSKPAFQGMLTFGPDVDVVLARFSHIKGLGPVNAQLRRNGRIQINSEDSQASAHFFIMLKHDHNNNLKYSEEVTKTEFEIVERSLTNLPDLSDDHFNVLIDSIRFLEKLNANRESKEFSKIIMENALDVVKYQFASPLNVFSEIETESQLSQFIIDYAYVLEIQIFNLIHNKSIDDFGQKNRKGTKTVMFKDLVDHRGGYANNFNHPIATTYNCYRDLTHAVSSAPHPPTSVGILPTTTAAWPMNTFDE